MTSSFANIEQVSKAVAEAKEGEYNFDLMLWPDIIKNYKVKSISLSYPGHKAPTYYDFTFNYKPPLTALGSNYRTFTDKYSLTRGEPEFQKKMLDFCIEKQLTVTPLMVYINVNCSCEPCEKCRKNTDIGVIFHWK
jgi:hypothetical protein